MDQNFDTFFNTLFGDSSNQTRISKNSAISTVPRANVSKNDQGYLITLAAPGLSREDFGINIENNTLSITSNYEDEYVEKKSNYTTQEFEYSTFTRTWSLPEGINPDSISARYESGLLKVDIPAGGDITKKVIIKVE